jgi:hypothetical protein
MKAAEIKVDPDPPKRGKSCTITYTGTLPVTLDLVWDPDTEPRKVTITTNAGTAINVPVGAWAVTITDPTGNAPGRDLPTAAP